MKIRGLFLIKPRVFCFIVIGLIFFDLLFSQIIEIKFSSPENQRIPSYDSATLNLWINQIRECQNYKIVMLGDSVVHGDSIASVSGTLPACVAKELQLLLPDKKISVFNMGLAGASPAEVFFILNSLDSSGVDLFIYDINLGWFGSEKTLEHYSLLDFNNTLNNDELQSLGITPLKPDGSSAEMWLNTYVFNHWKLYHYRVLLNYWLFGKPLRSKIEEAKKDPVMLLPFAENRSPETIEMRAPWRTKSWDKKLDPAKGRVGSFYLGVDNKQWLFYRMLLERIKNRNIPAVFFITPRNYELLEFYDMVDTPSYSRNLSIVAGEALKYDIPVLDYDRGLDYGLFSDTVHPLPEGNKVLAENISKFLIYQGYLER